MFEGAGGWTSSNEPRIKKGLDLAHSKMQDEVFGRDHHVNKVKASMFYPISNVILVFWVGTAIDDEFDDHDLQNSATIPKQLIMMSHGEALWNVNVFHPSYLAHELGHYQNLNKKNEPDENFNIRSNDVSARVKPDKEWCDAIDKLIIN